MTCSLRYYLGSHNPGWILRQRFFDIQKTFLQTKDKTPFNLHLEKSKEAFHSSQLLVTTGGHVTRKRLGIYEHETSDKLE